MNVNGRSVVWFFIGSLLGLIAAVWDFCYAVQHPAGGETAAAVVAASTHQHAAADESSSFWSSVAVQSYLYQALVLLAPLFYLLEAAIEITSSSHPDDDDAGDAPPLGGVGTPPQEQQQQQETILLPWNDLFFATGAICELSGTTFGLFLDTPTVASFINLLSTHAYCINGAMALVQHRHQQVTACCYCFPSPLPTSPPLLLLLHTSAATAADDRRRKNNHHDDRGDNGTVLLCGDVLFGAGATLDLILSYLALDRRVGRSWPITTSGCNLLSAICWNANAILYLVAWRWQQQQQQQRPPPQNTTTTTSSTAHHHHQHQSHLLENASSADNTMDIDFDDMDLETPLLVNHHHHHHPPPHSPLLLLGEDHDHHRLVERTESGGSMRHRIIAAKTTTPQRIDTGTSSWNAQQQPPRWIRERPHLV
jgi:hypothetical protein